MAAYLNHGVRLPIMQNRRITKGVLGSEESERMRQLQAAREARDFDKLRSTAHYLKGGLRHLACHPVADLAWELECLEDSVDEEALSEIHNRFVRLMERTSRQLAGEVKSAMPKHQ